MMRLFGSVSGLLLFVFATTGTDAASILEVHRQSYAGLTEFTEEEEIVRANFEVSQSVGGFISNNSVNIPRFSLLGNAGHSSTVRTSGFHGTFNGGFDVNRRLVNQHLAGNFGSALFVAFHVDTPMRMRFRMNSDADVESNTNPEFDIITTLGVTLDETRPFQQTGDNIFRSIADERNPTGVESFDLDETLPPGSYQFQAFAELGFEGQVTHTFRTDGSRASLGFTLHLAPIPEPGTFWLCSCAGAILGFSRRRR